MIISFFQKSNQLSSLLLGALLSLCVCGCILGVEEQSWKLAEGHFYPAVMPMELVYPRPDVETADMARHRWAYPGVLYRIPAAIIQGGSWPFYYEIIEGPESAGIGSRVESGAEYGVLSWKPRAADNGQTFTFVVRVTDQSGTSVDAKWTVTVDVNKFLFLSPTGHADNPGTIDKPMRDVADVYRGDANDKTFADRLVYFRAGHYQPVGQAGNENLRMMKGHKPMSFMAFPGEEAVLDATRANWTFWGGVSDVYFSGLQFVGSKLKNPDGKEIKNARNISFYGETNHERITFFEVHARDIKPGALGNDNPAFVWRPSSRKQRGRYWAFIGNVFENGGPKTGNGPCAVSLSCISYIVFERNRVIDWDGTGTLYDKANDDYITYRHNDLWHASTEHGRPSRALGAGLSNSYDPAHVPGFVEICYNKIRVLTKKTNAHYAISAAVSAVNRGRRNPVWVYRNSIVGTIDFVAVKSFKAVFDKNVVQGKSHRAGASIIKAGDNLWLDDLDAEVFDEHGHLLEAFREAHLGVRGAELD